jgi:hypothetical protein
MFALPVPPRLGGVGYVMTSLWDFGKLMVRNDGNKVVETILRDELVGDFRHFII